MGTHIATLTLNKSSQTTIPKVVRDFLGLSFGEKISVETSADEKSLILTKEKSLEERMEKLWEKDQFTPEQAARVKKYKNMTVAEMRADWDNSPEGRKYYAEKYGVKYND